MMMISAAFLQQLCLEISPVSGVLEERFVGALYNGEAADLYRMIKHTLHIIEVDSDTATAILHELGQHHIIGSCSARLVDSVVMNAVHVILAILFLALVHGLESNTNFEQGSSSSQVQDDEVEHDIYHIHLFGTDPSLGQIYRRGSGNEFRHVIRSHLAAVEQAGLEPSTFAVILHGKIQTGKTSLIRRIISSDEPDDIRVIPSPATLQTTMYTLELESVTIHFIDTPGFGSDAVQDQELVIQQMHAARSMIQDQGLSLYGLYFVVNPTERDALALGNNLNLIQSVYGAEAAIKIRFIINFCDEFAEQGEAGIRAFTDTLMNLFHNVFGVYPEKILFVCADNMSEFGCIGQFIDDLCNCDSLRQINISDTDATDQYLSAMNRYLEILQSSSSSYGSHQDRLETIKTDAETALRTAQTQLDADGETLQGSRNSLETVREDMRALRVELDSRQRQLNQLYSEAGFAGPEPSFDYDHFVRQSQNKLEKKLNDLQYVETANNSSGDDFSLGLACKIESERESANEEHDNFVNKLNSIKSVIDEIQRQLDQKSQEERDSLANISVQEAALNGNRSNVSARTENFQAAENELRSLTSLSTTSESCITDLENQRNAVLILACNQAIEQVQETTEEVNQTSGDGDQTTEQAVSAPAMNQE